MIKRPAMEGDSIKTLWRACLTPRHPQPEWVVQPQGLLIEKLSAMRCRTQTRVHVRPLSCSRMSPVLMKHSPYPLPSLSPHIPTKWVWWGSISRANRVRIVLLRSYLPSALQLSAYEDTGRVLSVCGPWLVVVFDCYSHLRRRLCKSFGGVEITFSEVPGCCHIVTWKLRI